MKAFFSKLIQSIARRLGLGSDLRPPREKFWADAYSGLILHEGANVKQETLDNARYLGIDVEALIAEHERRKKASWRVEFEIDLTGLGPDAPDVPQKLTVAGVSERVIETRGALLHVSLAGLYKRIQLPDKSMSLAEVISVGIEAIHQRLAEAPDEFPSNRYPFGADDWKLTCFRWIEDTQDWHLEGTWKPETRERTTKTFHPGRSIDLRRTPPVDKALVNSEAFPALEKVTISTWHWSNGTKKVMDISMSEEDCPPSCVPPHPEQPYTIRSTVALNALPDVEWDYNLWDYRTPATHCLEQQFLRKLGKPADWLLPFTVEAVFVDHHGRKPATDLRGSLVSGPTGPAPLPEGKEWPCCPSCGEPALFSQSLDMRDVGFADLLPGTTLVIFACNDCLDAGEWQNCSSVLWLGRDQAIVLMDRGNPSPVLQSSQWYGPDSLSRWDLPDEIGKEVERLENEGKAPLSRLSPGYGTKVGGVPFYLQTEEVFYDRQGVVMEYIAQIATPEHISAGGFGYISHSTATGETYIDFQDT